jgi:hypothetical protein
VFLQVDIANQFKQIGFFLAENSFVTILKEMATSPMPSIEVYGVSG